MLQLIDLAKDKNIPVAIIDIRIPPNYGPRYNKLFSDVFKQVAEESQIPLIPFFMEQVAIKPELMQQDGIHPNQEAQPMIADFMAKQLKLVIKEQG